MLLFSWRAKHKGRCNSCPCLIYFLALAKIAEITSKFMVSDVIYKPWPDFISSNLVYRHKWTDNTLKNLLSGGFYMRNKILVLTLGAILCIGSACLSFADNSTTIFDGLSIDGTKNDNDCYTSEMTFNYTAEDEDGVKAVSLVFGEKEVAAANYAEDEDGNPLELTTKVEDSFIIDKETLSDNETEDYEYEAILVIIDGNDDKVSKPFTFKADASVPQIKITGVKDDAAVNEEQTLKIAVTDNNPANATYDVVVKLNDEEVEKKENISAEDEYSYDAKKAGSYSIVVTASDVNGNESSAEKNFIVDFDGPEFASSSIEGACYDGYTVFSAKDDITAKASVKDELAGLKEISIIINDEEYMVYSDLVEERPSDAANDIVTEKDIEEMITNDWIIAHETEDATYDVKFIAEDTAGNKTTVEKSFAADVQIPELTLSGAKDGNVYNSLEDLFVKGKATDNYDKDISINITVKKDDSEEDKSQVDDAEATYEVSEDGTYEVSMQAVDMAGNPSEEKTVSFVCDTAGADFSDILMTGDAKGTYFNGDIKSKVTVKDEITGISEISITVEDVEIYSKSFADEEDITYSYDVEASITKDWIKEHTTDDSKYRYEIVVIDNAGNISSYHTTFLADVEAPELTLSGAEEGKIYNSLEDLAVIGTVEDNNKDTSKVTVNVKKDEEEDVETVLDGPVAYYSSFTDGIYTVSMQAKDIAGNTSDVKTVSFICDATGAGISDITLTADKENNFYSSDIDYSFTAKDALTGITDVKVELNGEEIYSEKMDATSDEIEVAETITKDWLEKNVSKDSSYTLKVTVTDAAGNEAVKEITFNADVTAPELTLSGAKEGAAYNSDVTVTAEMADQNTEVPTVTLIIEKDGEIIETVNETEKTSVSYSGFTEDGEYKVTAKGKDTAGNIAEEKTLSFVVDKTEPSADKLSVTSGESGCTEWFNDDVTVKTSVSDELAGITDVVIKVNGKYVLLEKYDPAIEGKDIEVVLDKAWFNENESDDDNYKVTFTVKDRAGNKTEREAEFTADVTTPAVELSGVKAGSFINEVPTVKATVTDKHAADSIITYTVYKDGEEYFETSSKGATYSYSDFKEDGKYTVIAKAEDIAGNVSVESTISFVYDTTAASLESISLDGNKKDGYSWYDSAVTASSTAKDKLSGLAKVTMTINGENVVTTSPEGTTDAVGIKNQFTKAWFKENASSTGKYEVKITAVDRAGNKATKTAEFYADVTAPSVELDGAVNGSFNNTKQEVTATLTDDYADNNKLIMNIVKDGKTYDTVEKKSTSLTYASFNDDGNYKVTVKAVDAAGNVSEIASVRFIYDTKAPSLDAISFSGSKNDGYSWFKGAVTINEDITEPLAGFKEVTVKVNDQQILHKEFTTADYDYSISKQLTKDWFKENESESGSYKVTITAVDRAGNTATKTKTFYCDVVKPGVSISGVERNLYTSKTPEITCEVSDNYKEKNTIIFDVNKDSKDYANIEKEASQITYSKFTKDGKYYMTVKAVDKAGNTSETKTLVFTKDTTAPVLAITGAKEDSYSTGSKNITAHIKELNYKNVTVKANITRELDGKTTTVGFAGVEPNKKDYTKSINLSKTGTYTVTLEAVDKAGNKAKSQKLTFTIDNDEPIIEITGVNDVNGYNASVTPKVTYEDSYLEKADISISRADGKEAKVSFKDSETAKGGTRTYSNFAKIASNDGVYTLTCTVTDKAGNKKTETQKFSVNRFGSTYKLSDASKSLNNKYVSSLENNIVITESNVTGLEEYEMIITKDGIKQEVDTTAAENTKDGWKTYKYTFNKALFDEEGVYQVNVTSKDTVGNFSEFLSDENDFKFYVDKTAPTIIVTGIEENGSYKGEETAVTIKVSDGIKMGDFVVTCDRKVVYDSSTEETTPETKEVILPAGLNQTVEVVATDAAGNSETTVIENVTISSNFFLRLWANKPLFFGILFGALAVAGGIIFLVKRRKKDDEEPAA